MKALAPTPPGPEDTEFTGSASPRLKQDAPGEAGSKRGPSDATGEGRDGLSRGEQG
jgi:hypothetical protein